MPRDRSSEGEAPEISPQVRGRGTGRPVDPALGVPAAVREALRPWLDIDEVGAEGLWIWLLSIVPALPKDPPTRDDPTRVEELARALAACAGDRARVHFQAAEYFRENRALARRLKALEAMLSLRPTTGTESGGPVPDPEAEAATRRYLGGKRA